MTRLRDRLIRLRLTPGIGMGVASPVDGAPAVHPVQAARVAFRALSDSMTTGTVSASVHTLVKGVLETMLWNKLRTTAATVFASGFSYRRFRGRRLGRRRRFKRAPHWDKQGSSFGACRARQARLLTPRRSPARSGR